MPILKKSLSDYTIGLRFWNRNQKNILNNPKLQISTIFTIFVYLDEISDTILSTRIYRLLYTMNVSSEENTERLNK